jgi:hypothetical protein
MARAGTDPLRKNRFATFVARIRVPLVAIAALVLIEST